MAKFFKTTGLVLLAVATVIGIALPWALPPAVKAVAEKKLAELGFPADVSLDIGYCWRRGPGIRGNLRVTTRPATWKLSASFAGSFGEWQAKASLPETKFSESEPTVARVLERYPIKAVSNLVFSGSIAIDATAERTPQIPVPVWSAKVPLRNLSADLMAGKNAVSVRGLFLTPGASGIANHLDISPLFLRADAITGTGFVLTNLMASVRATERALMVNEASAGFCGGKVSLYSLVLDPKTLNTGFTLFLDDVDAGEVLSHMSGFNGTARGHLHGKIKLFVKEGGKGLRFSDAFLYSTPGEIGKLQMTNPETLTDNLSLAGLSDSSRANVANALTDLDYSVLKLTLRRKAEKVASLGVRIDGTATRGELTVPVTLDITLNGELEQLINTGLNLPQKMKGTLK